MKLNLQRETLLKPLQLVIGVVERKQTLPILANVLLEAKDNILSITGTDTEVELIGRATLDASLKQPAQITVPGRKFIDICKALPEGAIIELSQEKERVVLRSERNRFTLSTLPASEFPNVEEPDDQFTFSIPQKTLRQLIARTYFAMAQQDVRYYLNGMLLELTSSQLRAVATDGHRLTMNTVRIPLQVEHRLQVIIPRKGVLELLRLLEDSDDPVTVSLGANHIRVLNDDYAFTSKLIEGRFPDYQRVIPKNNQKFIEIDRDEFKQALGRSAILCNEKFRGLCFEFRSNLLRILANNPEQEAAEVELPIKYAEENLDIGVNVNYLLDILNTVNVGPTKVYLSDPNSSLLIEEALDEMDGVFVVMPMRL